MQTCIVNKDKRHAFVKMLTRKDAVTAKENMEDNRTPELPLRVSLSSFLRSLPYIPSIHPSGSNVAMLT